MKIRSRPGVLEWSPGKVGPSRGRLREEPAAPQQYPLSMDGSWCPKRTLRRLRRTRTLLGQQRRHPWMLLGQRLRWTWMLQEPETGTPLGTGDWDAGGAGGG